MRSRQRLALGFGIAALILFGSLSAAQAQYAAPPPYYPPPGYGPPPPAPRGMYRSGLVFGFALGGGAITANNCVNCGGGAGGLEAHLGGMINPQTALLGEIWGLARGLDGGVTLTNTIYTVSLQYWLADQFWVKGGIGGGTIDLSDTYTGATLGGTSESAIAFSGAAGFEIVQFYSFALDLQFRLAHVAYSGGGANNIAFMVGFNWY